MDLKICAVLESNKFRFCEFLYDEIIPITISNKLSAEYKKFNLFENTNTAASNFYSKFIENAISEIKATYNGEDIRLMLSLPIIKTGTLNLINDFKVDNCIVERILSPTSAMAFVKHNDLSTLAPDDNDDDYYISLFFDCNSVEVGISNNGDGVCDVVFKIVIADADNKYITDDYIDFIIKRMDDERTIMFNLTNIKEIICFGNNSSNTEFISTLSKSIGCKKITHLSSEDSIIKGLILQQKVLEGTLRNALMLDCLDNPYEILINNCKRIPLFGYWHTIPTKACIELELEPSERNEISIIEVNHRFEEKIFSYVFNDPVNPLEVLTFDINTDRTVKIGVQDIDIKGLRYNQEVNQQKTTKDSDKKPIKEVEKKNDDDISKYLKILTSFSLPMFARFEPKQKDDENYFSQENLQKRNYFNHFEIDHFNIIYKNKRVRIPLYINILSKHKVFFDISNPGSNIESIILRIFLSLPHNHCHFHVLDASFGDGFKSIMKLPESHRKVISSSSEIDELLVELNQRAEKIISILNRGGFKDIIDYNSKNINEPIPLEFLLINNPEKLINQATVLKFNKLLKIASRTGLYFYFKAKVVSLINGDEISIKTIELPTIKIKDYSELFERKEKNANISADDVQTWEFISADIYDNWANDDNNWFPDLEVLKIFMNVNFIEKHIKDWIKIHDYEYWINRVGYNEMLQLTNPYIYSPLFSNYFKKFPYDVKIDEARVKRAKVSLPLYFTILSTNLEGRNSEQLYSRYKFKKNEDVHRILEKIAISYDNKIDENIKKNKVKVSDEINIFSKSSTYTLEIPIGIKETGDILNFNIGEEVGAYHGLISGTTGSGKSVLLHQLIVNGARAYSPSELEFVLLDLKGGVEFQHYQNLPHAKILAIDEDPDFAYQVLLWLQKEYERRNEVFKLNSVKNLEQFKEQGNSLSRIIIIIDEFQRLFDYQEIGKKAENLIENFVRQFRSVGMHILLSTQTPTGVNWKESTLEQIAIRMGPRMSTEAEDILFDHGNNHITSKFINKGEAAYNDALGLRSKTVKFNYDYVDPSKLQPEINNLFNKAKSQGWVDNRVIYKSTDRHLVVLPSISEELLDNEDITLSIGYSADIDRNPLDVLLFNRKRSSNFIIYGDSDYSLKSKDEILKYSVFLFLQKSNLDSSIFFYSENENNQIFPSTQNKQVNYTSDTSSLSDKIEELFNKDKGDNSRQLLIIDGIEYLYELDDNNKQDESDDWGAAEDVSTTDKFKNLITKSNLNNISIIIFAKRKRTFSEVMNDNSINDKFDYLLALQGGDNIIVDDSFEAHHILSNNIGLFNDKKRRIVKKVNLLKIK